MSEDDDLVPYDLTAEPKAYVFLRPGWTERLQELAPRSPEYCNVCENFPCLGNHPPDVIRRRRDEYTFSSVIGYDVTLPPGSPPRFGPPLRDFVAGTPLPEDERVSEDIHAEAREQYEQAAAFIRRGVMTRAELQQGILVYDAVPMTWPDPPIYFSPLRNLFRGPSVAEQRAAEERDRREWTEGIRRRLGLVAEVHRCHVERSVYGPQWAWWCARSDCGEFRVYRPTQAKAFAEALAHARSFVPEPPEETPVTELDLLAFDALCDVVQAEREAFAAALPARAAEVTATINEWLGGLLPEGMRFEWK